ncbi:MAG: 30S ribosome-binding factor RbfA [Pseudomonadota bacterium]
MPKDFQRSRRIEEQIQRLLVDLVRKEVKDPRVGLVTITAVEVSRDLSHAKVFFLPFDSKRPVEEVRTALASAAGFLRIHLKKLLQIRHVPELRFLPDKTIDEAARLSVLINSAVASDARRAADAPPAPGEATDEVDGVDDTDDTDEAGPAP